MRLDYDRRHRRRFALTTESGAEVLLDLSQAVRLHAGDALALDDGGLIAVEARAEPLLEISAHDATALTRIAWHLGNRHLPVQLLAERLRIRADHVIAEMVHHLGGHAAPVEAPFDPEAGAYSGAYGAGHGHHHEDDEA